MFALSVRLPETVPGLDQDEEYCIVVQDGEERRIRFHDYGEIYSVPGLYQKLFTELLKCSSPDVLTSLLTDQVKEAGASFADLHVLDLGAGVGLVGVELRKLGVGSLVGVDIVPEAAEAAERDYPGLYDAYHVGDIRELAAQPALQERTITALVVVSALSFSDFPPAAFQAAYDLVEPGGWIAFNVRDKFFEHVEEGGFPALIRDMVGDGRLELGKQHAYLHRRSVSGEELHYVAIIARKPAS